MYPEQGKSWLFPADSEAGHIVEHKEERDVLSKWGNDLRQSYRTLAQAAGVSELDVHLLMNHSLPGVNAGYITRDRLLRDHLRQQQQRISDLVVHSLDVKRDPSLVRWLGRARVEETADQAAHADALRQTGHTGPEAADAAHDQVDLHPGIGGGVEQIDHVRVD